MKKNLALATCLTTLLIGCDAATIDSLTLSNNGSSSVDGTDTQIDTDVDTDVEPATDSQSDSELEVDTNPGSTGAGTSTGLDGTTSTATNNGLVNSVGLIKLEPIGITVDSTRGLFGELPETLSEQEIRDWYIPPTDVCSVTSLTGDTVTPDGFVVLNQITSQISAGDSIILTDENGTYATLSRMESVTGPVYLPEVEIDQPAGMNLSVSIPGDDFSAFADIAVPLVPELQINRPIAGDDIGVATFFQWQPNNVPGSLIELYIGGLSTATNEGIFIACALTDDGSFAFPEDVQAQMGAGFIDGFTTLQRVGYNVATAGDSIVFVANSVQTILK